MTRLLWFLFLLIPLGVHADEYVLASSYSPPYSTENHDGILERVLREAFVRAGHSVSFRNLPAERALQKRYQGGWIDLDTALANANDPGNLRSLLGGGARR